MYNYMTGTITVIRGDYIVLENSGIGYLIRTPNPFDYELGTQITIHTYLHVREDVMDIFGFKTSDNRDFFLKLISVKGIGPKGALAILANGKIDSIIQAINQGDNKYLQKFPGIGPKASQQIILDLHGKINLNPQNAKQDEKTSEIIFALQSLGYKQSEINKIIPKIEENLEKPTGEIIKLALKALL